MSDKLRQSRQGLAAALVRATNDSPEVESCSSNMSGPVLYVSSSFSNEQPENLHDCSISLSYHNHISRHLTEQPDFRCIGQGSGHAKEDSFLSWTDAELLHELPGMPKTSSLQTLEELVEKLEFENEPNWESSRMRLTSDAGLPAAPARGDTTGRANRGIEDGVAKGHISDEDDRHSNLLETVLEME